MTRPLLVGTPDGMDGDDAELLARALELLDAAYVPGRHEVASALRSGDGSIQLGIHVDGTARRSGVCAEGVAIGNAIADAARAGVRADVRAVVSVLRRPAGTEHLIEPCGVCAELLSDYWPDAHVWVTHGDAARAVTARALLPYKQTRES